MSESRFKLSEKLEDQLEAVEWGKKELERIEREEKIYGRGYEEKPSYSQLDMEVSRYHGENVQRNRDIRAMFRTGLSIETIARVMECSEKEIELELELDESYVLN